MSVNTYEAFEAQSRAAGFDEVLVRRWAPDTVVGTHTHPFDVQAVMVEGELWLKCGDTTRHLVAGDTFTLDRDVPHDERYGPEGAVFWAARRHPR